MRGPGVLEEVREPEESIGTEKRPGLGRRRFAFFILVGLTMTALAGELFIILDGKGYVDSVDLLLLAAFIVNVVWLSLGMWNSLIGLVLRRARTDHGETRLGGSDGEACAVTPDADPGKVALAMTIRNESPAEIFARLMAMKQSLDATGAGDRFDYYILSDSSAPEAAAEEERTLDAWRAELADPARVTYRRRVSNDGFKPGNLRDFCRRWGGGYEFLVLLDADSLMTGETILRLVATMMRQPRLGILQSVIVGILVPSFFARLFEFGHRHGLRCATRGAVWWQDDRCQFWGHNAVIRLRPFIAHCEMPYLAGKGPFSGHIICHDQIEASFMHRAGYDVRVIAEESGSYEGVPPTVLDFMKRNHRWCQGNLKNLKVAGAPGLAAIDRFHLYVVAQRFLASPALVVFVLAAVARIGSWPARIPFPFGPAIGLYAVWMSMMLFPKVAGIADALRTTPSAYGGKARLMFGGMIEALFTIMLTPIAAVGTTLFIIGLMFGRTLVWDRQLRDGYRLSWRGAATALWPQTLLGLGLLAVLASADRGAAAWFAPFWLSLVLAVPFAVMTASPRIDRWTKGLGLCQTPEEREMPAVIDRFLHLKQGLSR